MHKRGNKRDQVLQDSAVTKTVLGGIHPAVANFL